MPQFTVDELLTACRESSGWISKLPGVAGVGVGIDPATDAPAIKILVRRAAELPEADRRRIVQAFRQFPVCFEEHGDIAAG